MLKKSTVAAVAAFGLVAGAWAEERATPAEAQALAQKAAAHAAQVGAEQAFKDFSGDAQWKVKDLYVFAYSMKGDCLASGANAQLIGKNQINMKDPDGKPFIQEMIAALQGGKHSVDYNWPNPLTKKVEPKTSYVVKLANYDGFVGAGAYK